MNPLSWSVAMAAAASIAGCARGGGLRDAGGGGRDGSQPVDAGLVDAGLDGGSDAGPPPACTEGCTLYDTDCTIGVCDMPTGLCRADPRPDSTTCDDGNPCTSADSCLAGACAGVGTDCSAMDDMCNAGVCDPSTGSCVTGARPDGTGCADTDPCTAPDTCTGGTCGGPAPDCTAMTDMCNTGLCDAMAGGCVADPVADGTACDDLDPTTMTDRCTAGVCVGSRGCRWLFISEEAQAAHTTIQRLFTDNGHTVDARTANGSTGVYSSDAALLGTYTHVVFHQHDRVLGAAELTALTNFVNGGGRLIVTGYDSLGSPTDSVLAGLVRCGGPGDGPFDGALIVEDASHPIAMGPAQTFTMGQSLTAATTDNDQCTPTGGARRIVSVSGSSKLQITEGIGSGGMVVYWNANGYTSGELLDWTGPDGTQPALQNLFVNVLSYLCR